MPNGSKPQILVVDDEPSIRESLGMLLVASGYDVAEAENGVSRLVALEQNGPRSDRHRSQHAADVGY